MHMDNVCRTPMLMIVIHTDVCVCVYVCVCVCMEQCIPHYSTCTNFIGLQSRVSMYNTFRNLILQLIMLIHCKSYLFYLI